MRLLVMFMNTAINIKPALLVNDAWENDVSLRDKLS